MLWLRFVWMLNFAAADPSVFISSSSLQIVGFPVEIKSSEIIRFRIIACASLQVSMEILIFCVCMPVLIVVDKLNH